MKRDVFLSHILAFLPYIFSVERLRCQDMHHKAEMSRASGKVMCQSAPSFSVFSRVFIAALRSDRDCRQFELSRSISPGTLLFFITLNRWQRSCPSSQRQRGTRLATSMGIFSGKPDVTI